MIRTGTTCFADQYFYMDRIVPAVRASGMRAALAYGVVEVGDDNAHDWAIRATGEFLDSLRGDARHCIALRWIAPHFTALRCMAFHCIAPNRAALHRTAPIFFVFSFFCFLSVIQ